MVGLRIGTRPETKQLWVGLEEGEERRVVERVEKLCCEKRDGTGRRNGRLGGVISMRMTKGSNGLQQVNMGQVW